MPSCRGNAGQHLVGRSVSAFCEVVSYYTVLHKVLTADVSETFVYNMPRDVSSKGKRELSRGGRSTLKSGSFV